MDLHSLSIDRFMIGWALFSFALDSTVMSFAVLDHVFMFIHYFIDTFFFSLAWTRLFHDLSLNAFPYGCAQVVFKDDEDTFDLCVD